MDADGTERLAPWGPLVRQGATLMLGGAGLAAALSIVGVIRADSDAAGAGVGSALVLAGLFAAGVSACALGCLARGRLQVVSLMGVAVSVVAVDLLALAFAAHIDASGYAKVVGVFFTWSVFLLLILGLALAAPIHGIASRASFLTTACALAVAAVVITAEIFASGGEGGFDPFGLGLGTGGVELRLLGAMLTVGATGWLATLAASRLDRAPHRVSDVLPDTE